MRKLELNNNCVLTQEQMNSVLGGENGGPWKPIKNASEKLITAGTSLLASPNKGTQIAGAIITTVGILGTTIADIFDKETTPGLLVPDEKWPLATPAPNDSLPNPKPDMSDLQTQLGL